MMVPMFDRLKARSEWKFFGVLLKADRALAIAWWAALGLRGLLPALFAIAMGALVGAVQRGNPLGTPLIASARCSCCCRFCRRFIMRSARTSAAASPRGSTIS